MTEKGERWYSIHQIDGKVTSHDGYLKRELAARKEPYKYIDDVNGLAGFLGATISKLGTGEDWAVVKEVFPGVEILITYRKEDAEFPSDLRALFRGSRIQMLKGEDLAALTIATVNHGLRYIREQNQQINLPPICYNV